MYLQSRLLKRSDLDAAARTSLYLVWRKEEEESDNTDS